MKILLVITGLGVGGAERLVTSLADRFVALGHEVLLVRLQGCAALRPTDKRVEMATLNMRRHPISVFLSFLQLRRLIKKFQPDVINSHLIHANIMIRVLRLFLPMPCVISSAHNNNEGGLHRMYAYRLTDRLADISTNVSSAAVKAFEAQGAVAPGRMVVIHNGIDTALFAFNSSKRERVRKHLGLEGHIPLVLSVGRLSVPKDYPNLLKAFSLLSQNYREAALCIVGDGPLRYALYDLAQSLGLGSRVRFLGVRYDIPDLMAACDCFVLSSAWEGFGLVVAEAMSCERLVVATDCGGVREVLGEAGFLVPPRDAKALSYSIETALGLTENCKKQIGVAARDRVVQHYSFDATAQRYLDLYEERRP